MIPTVIVNRRTVIHAKSDGTAPNAAPDVCKTPPNQVPVPYPNTAFSKDLADGSETVTVDGEPIAHCKSIFSTSTGDEAGSGGGVVSGTTKGKAKFLTYSFDVFVEGKNVCRLGDSMTLNNNAPNTLNSGETQGNLDLLDKELREDLCKAFCWCDGGNDGDTFVDIKPIKPLEA